MLSAPETIPPAVHPRPLLLALALVLSACDSTEPPVRDVGSFEATLTGEVEAALRGAAGAGRTAGGAGVSIQLAPLSTAPGVGPSIGLTGPLDAEGTYTLDLSDLGSPQVLYRDRERFLFAQSGTIRISRVTERRIEGTFEIDFADRPRADAPVLLRAEGSFSAVRY